jgi:hypothetical protein
VQADIGETAAVAVDRLPAHRLLTALGRALRRDEPLELVVGVIGADVDLLAVRVDGEFVSAAELPPGFEERLERKEYGPALVVWQAARLDHLAARRLSE